MIKWFKVQKNTKFIITYVKFFRNDTGAATELEELIARYVLLKDAATRAEGAISSTATASSVGPPVEVISYQAPLQPASSPVNLSVRYMKWNLVGIVRRDEGLQDDALSEEEQSASITVEFHDSTFHHSLHIKDEHGRSYTFSPALFCDNERKGKFS